MADELEDALEEALGAYAGSLFIEVEEEVEEEEVTIRQIIDDAPSVRALALSYTRHSQVPKAGSQAFKDYRAARRRFERYKDESRTPSQSEVKRIIRRLRRRRVRGQTRPADVTLHATITISKDTRRRTIQLTDRDAFSAGEMRRLLGAYDRRDLLRAGELFTAMFARRLGGQLPDIDHITQLRFD